MRKPWLIAVSLILALMPSTVMAQDSVTKSDLILVVGATGKTGRLLVADLHAQGYRVRGMVRDLEKGRQLLGKDIELVVADLTEPETLIAAMDGVDALINTAGAGLKGIGKSTPEWIDYQGTVNLVNIAKQHRLKKFVLLSSMGVTQEDHFLNKIANNVLQWKFKGEQVLRGSGINYSIIRPGGLTDKPGAEHQVDFYQGDTRKGGPIRREDVARVCVAALLLPEADKKTYEVLAVAGTRNQDFRARLAALKPD